MAKQNGSKVLQEIHDCVVDLLEEYNAIDAENASYRASGKADIIADMTGQIQKYKSLQLNSGKLAEFEVEHESNMLRAEGTINNYKRLYNMYGEKSY